MMITSILFYLVASFFALFIFKHRRYYFLAFKIPSLVIIPILGDLLLLVGNRWNLVKALDLLKGTYGPIFRLWGRTLFTFVNSADFVEIVLTHPSLQNRDVSMDGMREILGEDSLFTVEAEKAKQIKKVFVKSFNSSKTFSVNIKAFRKETDDLISDLEKEQPESWVEIMGHMERTTTLAIMRSAADADLRGYPNVLEEFSRLKQYKHVIAGRGISPLHQINFLYMHVFGGKEYHKFIKSIHDFTTECILDMKNKMGGLMKEGFEVPNNFLFNLLREKPNASNNALLQDTLTVFAGALDTSAITISFALTMLAIHQEIQQKVYEEDMRVLAELAGREMEDEDFLKYEYLSRVIKETLRLYPSAPLTSRLVTEEIRFGKYILPKGSSVVASVITLHRNPKYHAEPLRFDPDRFSEENTMKRLKFTYIPFGAGQRSCPGYRYAYQFTIFTVAAIIRNFKVFTKYQSVEHLDKNLDITISLNEKYGFPMRLKKR